MNSDPIIPKASETARSPEELAAIAEFISAVKSAGKASKAAGDNARAALPRLVDAAYNSNGSQSHVVITFLASCYNSAVAQPVRLDEIRRLDWNLREGVAALIIGTNQGDFKDSEIREAFRAIGGDDAVNFFEDHVDSDGPKRALTRLVSHIASNRHASSAVALLGYFRSIVHRDESAELSRMNYMDDKLGSDFALVLNALFGGYRSRLYIESITDAFVAADILPLLMSEQISSTRK